MCTEENLFKESRALRLRCYYPIELGLITFPNLSPSTYPSRNNKYNPAADPALYVKLRGPSLDSQTVW